MLDGSSMYVAIRQFVGALALTSSVLCFVCVVVLPT